MIIQLNIINNSQVLNITNLKGHKKLKKDIGYGLDNWMGDDGTPIFWNKDSIILIKK